MRLPFLCPFETTTPRSRWATLARALSARVALETARRRKPDERGGARPEEGLRLAERPLRLRKEQVGGAGARSVGPARILGPWSPGIRQPQPPGQFSQRGGRVCAPAFARGLVPGSRGQKCGLRSAPEVSATPPVPPPRFPNGFPVSVVTDPSRLLVTSQPPPPRGRAERFERAC